MNNQAKKHYKWLVWGVLVLCYVVVFFHRLAAGVVKNDLIEAFQISGTTFGTLGAMYFYAYMLMQIPAGMLADTLGARKTVTLGTILSGIGSIVFGMAPTIAVAFIGRLMVGLGVSVIFIAILKVLSVWFEPSAFGKMSGLTSFVGNMGGILAQTPLALLSAAITWRMSFVAMGIVSLVLAVLTYTIVRNRPEDLMEGHKGVSTLNDQNTEPKTSESEEVNLLEGLKIVVSNFYTWPGFFVFAGLFGAFAAMTGAWGQSFLVDVYGMTLVEAANHMAMMVLGTAIGSIVIGQVSDRLRLKKKPMQLFSALCFLGWTTIVWVKGIPQIWLMPLLFSIGFTTSAFILGWGSAKELNPKKYTGIATSVVNIGGFFGAAIMPTLLGRVFDQYGHLSADALYQKAFMLCWISVLIGFIGTFFIKETYCENRYEEWIAVKEPV